MNKTILVLLTLLFSQNALAAINARGIVQDNEQLRTLAGERNLIDGYQLSCKVDSGDDNRQVIFVDKVTADCKGPHSIEFTGAGLGLKGGLMAWLEVSCLGSDDGISGEYYGVKANAALSIGLDVGVFVGSNGICFVAGFEALSFGAGIAGSKLTIN